MSDAKKILFIAPRFYNYHEIIKLGFEDVGFEVDYYDDRPSSGFFTKALIRINRKLVYFKIKKYFNSVFRQIEKKKYDLVIVIYGQSFSKKMMMKIKSVQSQARFIFYMYDPISSQPDRVEFSKIFDDVYSFDSVDCDKYGFKLLPLFYSFDKYPKNEEEYDASLICTMMPGKYRNSKLIINQLKEAGYRVFDFEYLQSKLVYRYFKFLKKEFRMAKSNEFVYKRLSNSEVVDLISRSRIIIDCQKEGQSGLTIRTFETLAAEKKLITTNMHIKEYDFYRPENIYVFEGYIDFTNVFFSSEYVHISDSIKNNYTLKKWVEKILENYNEN